MMTDDGDTGGLSHAINACDIHQRHHRRMGLIALLGLLALLAAVALFAISYSRIEASLRDGKRIDLLRQVTRQEQTVDSRREELVDARRSLSLYERELAELRFKLEKSQGKKEKAELAQQITEIEDRLKSHKEDIERAQKAADEAESERVKLEGAVKKSLGEGPILLSDSFLIGLVGVVVLIVSVFTSLYRFHLKEMTRHEQYKLDFLRIHIAAANSSLEGFQSEVRRSLTENAFAFTSERGIRQSRKLESPLPGHPASDLATVIVDKVLERLDDIIDKRPR